MSQLSKPFRQPVLQKEDYITPIRPERASALAKDAMKFSFKVLATVSVKSEEQIEATFQRWYKERGSKILNMSSLSARNASDPMLDDDGMLQDFPPAPIFGYLRTFHERSNRFQQAPTF